MKIVLRFTVEFVFLSVLISACSESVPPPTETAPPVEMPPTAQQIVQTNTPTLTAIPTLSPSPTAEQLRLEIVQSQAWTDYQGNVRVNVLLHNPYDFPVAPAARARADLLNSAGVFMRDQALYFLDGISGGNGFLLPGETVAANACFTCERTPLNEEWKSVEFLTSVKDATGSLKYSTEVEASIGNVSFSGESPLFDISGTVKNNSDSTLQRISARVFVYDQDDKLIGAAEASAWDVGPGATASFSGVGIGQAPAGSVKYEITALGVNY